MRLNVDLHYGKLATATEILMGNYDKVILATGSKSKMSQINGIDFASSANEYLTGKKQPGKKVIFIGGGLVGCETALYMSEFAEVTIVEMLDDILKTVVHSKNNDMSLRDKIAEANINILTSTNV